MDVIPALAGTPEAAGSAALASVAALPEALDAPRRQLVSAQAGRLSYYADDSAQGRPVVLIHSVNAAPSSFEMKPLFEHFRNERPVYSLDLPGFGFSDRSKRRYSPALFAQAIEDFLTQVVKAQADIITLSLGGELAARALLQLPESASSLVLISPTGFSDRSLPSPALGAGLHRSLSVPFLSQGLYDLLTSRPSIRYFLGRSFNGPPPGDMIDYAYATAHQPGARYAPLYFLSGQLFTADALNTLYGRLALPALVIYDEDANVSFERLPDFLATHENWSAERVAPTRGVPHWEKPLDTAAVIERFWGTAAAA